MDAPSWAAILETQVRTLNHFRCLILEAANPWLDYFRNWPADVEKRGYLVTNFDEQVPFDGFIVSPTLLIVDRKTPDTVGCRKLVIPFQNIAAVKIIDIVKNRSFASLGFEEPRGKK